MIFFFSFCLPPSGKSEANSITKLYQSNIAQLVTGFTTLAMEGTDSIGKFKSQE
jgi:hypothetical protein